MGSRHKKSLNDFNRKQGTSSAASSVLIVCEGEKTEPRYFSSLTNFHRLQTVEVVCAQGSAPMSIVADAASRRKARILEAKESIAKVEYEHVWCVFDVDEHPNIRSALETARANRIKVALSNPCFEYWLILHFGQFGSTNLTRQAAVRELDTRIGGYEKGKDYGQTWIDNYATAIQNARIHHKAQCHINPLDANQVLGYCPSTGVHLLVDLIHKMAHQSCTRH